MNIYILDASVIMRFVLDTQSEAHHLFSDLLSKKKRKDIQLIAPPLLQFEIANSLRFSIEDEAVSKDLLTKFFKLPISPFEMKISHFLSALKLSYQTRTTVYDAQYHIVAKAVGGVFLTCDAKYYKKAQHLGSVELWK